MTRHLPSQTTPNNTSLTTQRCIQGQVLQIPEEPVSRYDGVVRLFETVKAPIFDEAGKVIMTVGVSRDITERKQAESEREKLIKDLQVARRIAQENSRLKSEFLATMSHELRTPMNAIEGFTSILLNGFGDVEFNPAAEDFIRRIQSNSKRLLALINDFLDLSRIESGRLELAHMAFSAPALVKKWEAEIGVLADKKHLTFEIDIAPTFPDVLYGDPEAISKIAINLLSNAIKFTDHGRFNLSLQHESDNWIMVVRDTGIGIPPHAREYVFEEFRQVDQSSKRKHGGTGLGLAIVQKLVRYMGGSVVLESELDKGSTFTVTFPIKGQDQAS